MNSDFLHASLGRPGIKVHRPGLSATYRPAKKTIYVCLTAPTNLQQFEENLAAVRQGPLSEVDMEFMRQFGDAVHA
jgi:hypothetical protein